MSYRSAVDKSSVSPAPNGPVEHTFNVTRVVECKVGKAHIVANIPIGKQGTTARSWFKARQALMVDGIGPDNLTCASRVDLEKPAIDVVAKEDRWRDFSKPARRNRKAK